MDLDVGSTFGPSGWRRVTQDEIDAFAPHQRRRPVDPHRRRAREAREPVRDDDRPRQPDARARSTASATSWSARSPAGTKLGVNLGYDRVRFPAPVRVDAEVRATMEIRGWTTAATAGCRSSSASRSRCAARSSRRASPIPSSGSCATQELPDERPLRFGVVVHRSQSAPSATRSPDDASIAVAGRGAQRGTVRSSTDPSSAAVQARRECVRRLARGR